MNKHLDDWFDRMRNAPISELPKVRRHPWDKRFLGRLQWKSRIPSEWHKLKWLYRAWKEHPKGRRCGWCNRRNFFADNMGWFSCNPFGEEMRYTCKTCYDSWVGELHRKRWGDGQGSAPLLSG